MTEIFDNALEGDGAVEKNLRRPCHGCNEGIGNESREQTCIESSHIEIFRQNTNIKDQTYHADLRKKVEEVLESGVQAAIEVYVEWVERLRGFRRGRFIW